MYLVNQINVEGLADSVGTPTIKNAFNQFDEHGLVVNLSRLAGEKNWEFKQRIQDVFVHQANSSYRGLIYGITRELGLELFYPITINPKLDPATGDFLASDPYIKFEGAYLYLYSDYANDILEWKIDRWMPGGNYEHLGNLINAVNSSSFFEAGAMPGIDLYTKSMTILNQSCRLHSGTEDVPLSTKWRLLHEHIIPGTLTFSQSGSASELDIEVSSLVDLDSTGEYYVDYVKGIVETCNPPERGTFVRYQYTDYLFKPVASPVILNSLTSEDFKVKMFEQILQDDGTYAHGLPTELGVDLINELYSTVPLYWGL